MQKDKKLLFISLILALCLCFTLASCKNEDDDDEPKYQKDMVFTFLDQNGVPIAKKEITFGNPFSNQDVVCGVKTDENGRATINSFPECEVTFETVTGHEQTCLINREILDSGEYTVVFQGYTVKK